MSAELEPSPLGPETLAQLDTERGMPLLTDEIREHLPPLYSGEQQGLDAFAQVKFFSADGGWTWYASEYDGEDLFFGLVVGHEIELGYWTLTELAQARGPMKLLIERDLYYHPASLRELKEMHETQRRPW